MSELRDIVKISIDRQTQAISIAGFGTPAIVSEFPASKTSPAFDRYAYYGQLSEMTDAGWSSTDKEYIRAQKIFSQNPRPNRVMIGRKKPDSEAVETWTEALTAIQGVNRDWYGFTIKPTQSAKVVFDSDFVVSNNIDMTVNGITVTTVPFNSNQLTTMNDLITQIEADVTDAVAALDPTDTNNRTLIIQLESGSITAVTAVVTGGATQPVATITYTTDDDVLEVAAWTETEKKIFFHTSDDIDIPTSSTTDIASQLAALNYDRTAVQYHPNLSNDQYFSEAWIGDCFPRDPGSQTWCYKNFAGITSYNLTSGERAFALDKSANIYTETAGVDITEVGKVASGEYIDIIRGIDWLEARLAENIFSELINVPKIPYTDEGVAIIEGLVKEVLDRAVVQGIITADYVVTVPLVADIPDADKLARNLPDVKFTATLQGAIHTVEIEGVVSV